MKLKDIGEFGFIDRVKPLCLVEEKGIIKAIGDDCAVYEKEGSFAGLLTTDMLVENVHFLRDKISPFDLGYKAMAVNLSDIAAMGGKPLNAFLSIAVPETITIEFLDALYEGMMSLGRKFKVNVLGGDTTGSKRDLVLNIALTGEAERSRVMYRSGARPGDRIYVNGFLGESAAGLDILLRGGTWEEPVKKHLINAHIRPGVCIEEGIFLAGTGDVTACIDVSDGLSSDLAHICRQSGSGALLYEKSLPVSEELKAFARTAGKNPVDIVLSGGEDYKLLFTVRENAARDLEKSFQERFGYPLFRLGEMRKGRDIGIKDESGMERQVLTTGWDHFSLPNRT